MCLVEAETMETILISVSKTAQRGEEEHTNTRWRRVRVAMKDDLPLGYLLQMGSKNEI